MGPIQLVVFDLAGTTINDNGMVLECFVQTVRAYDMPGTPEELNALMGLNKREVFGMLAGRLYSSGSPEADNEIYTETIDDKIHIVTGIAGKGMSTGPGFARSHISSKLS